MSAGNGVTGPHAPPRVSLLPLARKVAGEVEIYGADGKPRWTTVLQHNGVTAHMRQEIDKDGAENVVGKMYDMAEILMPDATRDEIRDMSIDGLSAVLAIANGMMEAVQKEAEARAEKNVVGSASPPSKPARRKSPATSSRKTT